MHVAFAHGNVATVRALINAGLEPTQANPGTDGKTPNEVAREAGSQEVANYLASLQPPTSVPPTATLVAATLACEATCSSAQSCSTAGEVADYLKAYLLGDGDKWDCLAEIEDVTVRQGGTRKEASRDLRIAMRSLVSRVFTPADGDAELRPWIKDVNTLPSNPVPSEWRDEIFWPVVTENGELGTTAIDGFATLLNTWQRRWLPPPRTCEPSC